jgi:hypothetical protein
MLPTYQILLTGLGHNDVHRLVTLLESFDIDFHRIPWNGRLLAAVKRTAFDVVIAGHPGIEMPVEALLEALRDPEAASRHAGLVLFTEPVAATDANRLLGRGVNRVASRTDPDRVVQESILSLIDVPRRFQVRAPVELSRAAEPEPTTTYCHTENLSMSGMLVSCARPQPVGALLDFALLFPDEEQPIRGRARVARIADPRREKVLGVGAAFESFSQSDRSRLRSVLSRRYH